MSGQAKRSDRDAAPRSNDRALGVSTDVPRVTNALRAELFCARPIRRFSFFLRRRDPQTLACLPRCAPISPPLKCTHLFFRSLFCPRSMLGYIGDSCRAGFLFSCLNKRVRPASNTHYTTFSFAPSALLPHTFSMEYEFRYTL